MEKAEMKIIRFDEKDVIATSGNEPLYYVVKGLGDGYAGNASIRYGNTSWTNSLELSNEDRAASISAVFNLGITTDTVWKGPGTAKTKYIFSTGDGEGNNFSGYNGSYSWDGTQFTKVQ